MAIAFGFIGGFVTYLFYDENRNISTETLSILKTLHSGNLQGDPGGTLSGSSSQT